MPEVLLPTNRNRNLEALNKLAEMFQWMAEIHEDTHTPLRVEGEQTEYKPERKRRSPHAGSGACINVATWRSCV